MSTRRTYYKVARLIEEGKYCSFFVTGKARKIYRLGSTHKAPKWLASKGYHLTVFRDLQWAEDFVFCNHLLLQYHPERPEETVVILRVTALTTDEAPLPRFQSSHNLKEGMLTFDPLSSAHNYFSQDPSWPRGTAMLRKLKIEEVLREVPKSEY